MKKIFLYMLVILQVSMTNAQTSQTWNFEEGCSNYSNSFFLGCIPNAITTHGSPDTEGQQGSQYKPDNFEGERYAHMFSKISQCNQVSQREHGDGFVLNYNFLPNFSYTISFAVTRSPGSGATHRRAQAYLTNGLVNQDGSGEPGSDPCEAMLDLVPPIPGGSPLVWEENTASIPSLLWAQRTITVTPTQSFSQLWLMPRSLGGLNQIGGWNLYIDNVVITKCPRADFNVALCKVGSKVRATISGTDPTLGGWKLYSALNCNGQTGNQNIGTEQPFTWANLGSTQIMLNFNSGCYILEQEIPPSISGCPKQLIRRFIDSNYAPLYNITGGFTALVDCNQPSTFSVRCNPPIAYFNGIDHWAVYDVDLPNNPPQLYTRPSGTSLLLTGLITGHTYRITHYVTIEALNFLLCVESPVVSALVSCLGGKNDEKGTGIYTVVAEFIDTEGRNEDLPVSVGNKVENSAIVAPNPMSSDFTILKFNKVVDQPYTVSIYDLNGRQVREYADATETELQIDRDGLVSGIYFIKIRNETGFLQSLKLVVP